MKIVVTGSSGHVGGAIARYLHEQGNEVIGISRSCSTTLPEAITQLSLDIATDEFIQRARKVIDTCDSVVHAAACLGEAFSDTEITRVNCLGTQHVIDLARQVDATCLVYISGLNILGIPQQHPITEEHPIAPRSTYAASKAYGEYLVSLSNSDSMRSVSMRVSSPVGPGLKRARIFRIFVERALKKQPIVIHGSGTRRQDYVDVRDVACGVEATVSLENPPSGIFNITSGCPVSNQELANLCINVLNSESKIVHSGKDDPQDCVSWDMSIEKAGKILGYTPQYPLHTSIADLAAEIRQGR